MERSVARAGQCHSGVMEANRSRIHAWLRSLAATVLTLCSMSLLADRMDPVLEASTAVDSLGEDGDPTAATVPCLPCHGGGG